MLRNTLSARQEFWILTTVVLTLYDVGKYDTEESWAVKSQGKRRGGDRSELQCVGGLSTMGLGRMSWCLGTTRGMP